MTISVRQSAYADATPHAATFPSTPVAGNLLVAVAMERSGETDFVMSNTGWTLGVVVIPAENRTLEA